VKPDGSSESEAVLDPLLLKSWKSHSLSSPYSAVEVLECFVQVSEGLLRSTLGTLVHPGKLGLLQTIEESVLLHGVSEPVCSLVGPEEMDTLFETPVIGKTSDSCMLVEAFPLLIVRVQFVPVSLGHQHEVRTLVLIGRYKPIQSPLWSWTFLETISMSAQIFFYL